MNKTFTKRIVVASSTFLFSILGLFGIMLGLVSALRYIETNQDVATDNTEIIEVAESFTLGVPPLSGTFLDLYWDTMPADKVEAYLNELQEVGMDTVIVVNTRKRVGTCNNLTFTDERTVSTDSQSTLYKLVEGTSRRNMNLYLGLIGFNECTPAAGLYENPNAIAKMEIDIKATVERFETAFRNFSSLKGYYITDEPIRFWYSQEEGTTVINNFNTFYKKYVQAIDGGVATINSRNPATPKTRYTLASPTFGGIHTYSRTPEWVGNWLLSFKNFTGIDTFAVQDTVGGLGLYSFPYPIKDYYTAMSQKIGVNNLWVNHELFNYKNNRTTIATRVKQQVNEVRSSDVSKRITWSHHIYMSNVWLGHYQPSTRLKETYLAQFNVKGQVLTPTRYIWLQTPANNYPDSGNELFDGKVGDPRPLNTYGSIDTKWTGLRQTNGAVSLWVEFNEEKNISWISAQLLRDKNSGVRIPRKIEIQCVSRTGVSELEQITIPSDSTYNEDEYIETNGGDYTMSNVNKYNSNCSGLILTLYNSDWTFLSELEIVSSPN